MTLYLVATPGAFYLAAGEGEVWTSDIRLAVRFRTVLDADKARARVLLTGSERAASSRVFSMEKAMSPADIALHPGKAWAEAEARQGKRMVVAFDPRRGPDGLFVAYALPPLCNESLLTAPTLDRLLADLAVLRGPATEQTPLSTKAE